MRRIGLVGGLISVALVYASCSNDTRPASTTGGQGGGAGVGNRAGAAGAPIIAGDGGETGGTTAGEAGRGGSGEAGHEQGLAGTDGADAGAAGVGGAGGNAAECADAQNGAHCDNSEGVACVLESEVCLCDVTDNRGGYDVFTWVCVPRGCPETLPGPRGCMTTTLEVSQIQCHYGDRSCTCETELGMLSEWRCPMVCPSARPAEHDPCVPSGIFTSDDDTCTYDTGSCVCRLVDPLKNDAAAWTCTDGSGGAPN